MLHLRVPNCSVVSTRRKSGGLSGKKKTKGRGDKKTVVRSGGAQFHAVMTNPVLQRPEGFRRRLLEG